MVELTNFQKKMCKGDAEMWAKGRKAEIDYKESLMTFPAWNIKFRKSKFYKPFAIVFWGIYPWMLTHPWTADLEIQEAILAYSACALFSIVGVWYFGFKQCDIMNKDLTRMRAELYEFKKHHELK